MNWYAYVGNEPMNKVDPDGTCGLFKGKLMGRGCTYAVAEGAFSKPRLLASSNKPVGNVAANSGLGARKVEGGSDNHEGTDYPVGVGTSVFATASGKVVYQGNHKQYGKHILIEHKSLSGTTIYTRYAHANRIDVKKNDALSIGTQIMLSGNSGRSTGPHLHYEVIKTAGTPTCNGFFTASRTYHSPNELEGLLNDM